VSYQNYVIACYAVFIIVLAWDYVAPRLQVRRELAAARRRAQRTAARSDANRITGELNR